MEWYQKNDLCWVANYDRYVLRAWWDHQGWWWWEVMDPEAGSYWTIRRWADSAEEAKRAAVCWASNRD